MASIDRINKLHPKLRSEALDIYNECRGRLTGKAAPIVVQGLRTIAEQNALYAQGRTKPGPIVTKAKGGLSLHNYGLAIDYALVIDGKTISWKFKTDYDNDKIADFSEVVQIHKEYGWEWGGDWKFVDQPHFQKTFGYNVRQLLDLHNKRLVDKNGYVIMRPK